MIGKPPPATPKLDQFRAKKPESEANTQELVRKTLGILKPYRRMATYDMLETIARPFGDHSMTILKSSNMFFDTL